MEPLPGSCAGTLYADYFNQSIYGWEPLIEPFRIDSIAWKHDTLAKAKELQIVSRQLPILAHFAGYTVHIISDNCCIARFITCTFLLLQRKAR